MRFFAWVKRLFGCGRDVRERAIYEFFDGVRWRRVDPIAVWHAFHRATARELDELLRSACRLPTPGLAGKLAEDAVAQRSAEMELLQSGIKQAFGVSDYDGTNGLLEAERVALAVDYLQYLARLADTARPTPALQKHTEQSPAA